MRARLRRAALAVSGFAGSIARALAAGVRLVPGLAAGTLGTAAAWEAWGRPAGLGAAAAFLLLVDRRTS